MDFSAALDTNANDVQKPKVLPQGTYTWTITKQAMNSISSAKGDWDVVDFTVRAVSAEDDVDPDELEEFGALSSALNRVSFMFNKAADGQNDRDKALYNLTKFLRETLSVEPGTVREMIAMAPNNQFLARAVWSLSGDDTYVNLKDMMPLS